MSNISSNKDMDSNIKLPCFEEELKTCKKLLPYASPRVVIRVPDIHGGLDQTVVSISDSDPCSPCDMTFRDISKTLCSPRTMLPDSVKKSSIEPSAAVRKVDVTNPSGEAPLIILKDNSGTEKQSNPNSPKDSDASKSGDDGFLSDIVELNEVHDAELSSQHSQSSSSTLMMHHCTENVLKSPLTFYSSPKFHTIHWSPNQELLNMSCEEPEPEKNRVYTFGDASLNTPPSTLLGSKGDNSVCSDIDYNCLDMKSPPNVNIFAAESMTSRLNHTSPASVTESVQFCQAPEFINKKNVITTNLVDCPNNLNAFRYRSRPGRYNIQQSTVKVAPQLKSVQNISSRSSESPVLKVPGDCKSSVIQNQTLNVKRSYQQIDTSSSDENNPQSLSVSSKRKLFSSCRSYRQYKQSRRKTLKSVKKVKDYVTPYAVDTSSIHGSCQAKTPSYDYNRLNFESGLHGAPKVMKPNSSLALSCQQRNGAEHGTARKTNNGHVGSHNFSSSCVPSKAGSWQIIPGRSSLMGQKNFEHKVFISREVQQDNKVLHIDSRQVVTQYMPITAHHPLPYNSSSVIVSSISLGNADRFTTLTKRIDSQESVTETEIPNKTAKGPVEDLLAREATEPIVLPKVPDFLIPSVSTRKKLDVDSYSYPIRKLQIGTYKYCAYEQPVQKKIAVLQIQKGLSLLVYEFELQRTKEDEGKKKWPFALLEISFQNISNVRQKNGICLILEVNVAPAMYIAYRESDRMGNMLPYEYALYKEKKVVDLTHGQLAQVPYHEVELCSDCAQYIVNTLALSASHLLSALRKEMVIVPQKLLKTCKNDQSHRGVKTKPLILSRMLQDETHKKSSYICQCTQGCQLPRCGCQFRSQPCSDMCRCHRVLNNCSNPHSISQRLGLSLAQVRKDDCLMANLAKVLKPEYPLQKPVQFPCCGYWNTLEKCIHGGFICPACSQTSLKFSWCHGVIFNEELDPKFHCNHCGKCTEKDSFHCEICNKCHSPKNKCYEEDVSHFLQATHENGSSDQNVGKTVVRSLCAQSLPLILHPQLVEPRVLSVNLATHDVMACSSTLAFPAVKNFPLVNCNGEKIQINAVPTYYGDNEDRTALPFVAVSDIECNDKEENPPNVIKDYVSNRIASRDNYGLDFGTPACTSTPVHKNSKKKQRL